MQLIGPPPRPADAPPPLPALPAQVGLGGGARLWLVRHAEVEARWHDVAYGAMDVALSAAGLAATARLGAAFEGRAVSLVVASDLDRAARLGRAIAAAGRAPLRLDAALREMHRGAWQGKPKGEFRALWDADAASYWRDPYAWHVPDGEGDALIFARAWPVLASALAEVGAGTLVVAAHGQLIRVVSGRLLGLGAPESYAWAPSPAHAHLFVDAPGGWGVGAQDVDADGVR
ncbi:MAG: histidine phosphatase family protein [Planctomycetes bacterium]|nr:histidine phosphatase family protein [Planctomycetota bacterium]